LGENKNLEATQKESMVRTMGIDENTQERM
jgi:hypothetical protein